MLSVFLPLSCVCLLAYPYVYLGNEPKARSEGFVSTRQKQLAEHRQRRTKLMAVSQLRKPSNCLLVCQTGLPCLCRLAQGMALYLFVFWRSFFLLSNLQSFLLDGTLSLILTMAFPLNPPQQNHTSLTYGQDEQDRPTRWLPLLIILS